MCNLIIDVALAASIVSYTITARVVHDPTCVCNAMTTDWRSYVAIIQEEFGGDMKHRHLMPVTAAPTPIFLEANVENKLRLVFQEQKWYISEQHEADTGSGVNKKQATTIAVLEIDHWPTKQHQWTHFSSPSPTPRKLSCDFMTVDQYSTTILCVKMAEGAVQANETNLARQEYDLAAKNYFESFQRLQADTVKLQRDTSQFFQHQQKQNEHVDNRLRKLESLMEENPSKYQRTCTCTCRKALLRVKRGEWVYPGDVVYLAHKGSVREYTVRSWTHSFNYILSNENGEEVESHTRNMHWPSPEKCEACRGTDTLAPQL